MPLRLGAKRRRFSIALILVSLCLVFSSAVSAQQDISPTVLEQRAMFPVTDPPSAPFHVHQSMILFAPGAMAPLHRHGGPGYITILDGELTLYEDGEANVYQAGQSLVETPDKLYKGGNFTERDMILMVTYLVPEGEEVTTPVDDPDAPDPPEVAPEPLAQSHHEYVDPPSSFDLIHHVRAFQPQAELEPAVSSGTTLVTVVNGSLTATVDGMEQTLETGDQMSIEAGQEYSFVNNGDSDTLMMSTEMTPDTYSMAPDAGSAVDRTVAIWLMIMIGGAILVIGAVMRLSVVRIR